MSDPHRLKLPDGGSLKINFVDLRPVPPGTPPLSRQRFVVLLCLLGSESHLHSQAVLDVLDEKGVDVKVGRRGHASGRGSSGPKGRVARVAVDLRAGVARR